MGLPQCQWSNPEAYGLNQPYHTTPPNHTEKHEPMIYLFYLFIYLFFFWGGGGGGGGGATDST